MLIRKFPCTLKTQEKRVWSEISTIRKVCNPSWSEINVIRILYEYSIWVSGRFCVSFWEPSSALGNTVEVQIFDQYLFSIIGPGLHVDRKLSWSKFLYLLAVYLCGSGLIELKSDRKLVYAPKLALDRIKVLIELLYFYSMLAPSFACIFMLDNRKLIVNRPNLAYKRFSGKRIWQGPSRIRALQQTSGSPATDPICPS